jgi:hypothetical protein
MPVVSAIKEAAANSVVLEPLGVALAVRFVNVTVSVFGFLMMTSSMVMVPRVESRTRAPE